jgi:hypothetical protein
MTTSGSESRDVLSTNGKFLAPVQSCSTRRARVKEQVMYATARWQEWASFVLGLWLAVSPWLVGYAEHEAATANAVFLGLALALGSHFEATLDENSADWLNMAAGLWLLAAPFVLGFSAVAVAAANSIAVGTLVMALAASALSLDKEIGKWWHKKIAGH